MENPFKIQSFCKKRLKTGTLIAEIPVTSVEDSFRIGVLIASATALNAENVTYHAHAQYTVLLKRSNLYSPTPQLTSQSVGKHELIIVRSQGRNMKIILCMQNLERNILNTNRL